MALVKRVEREGETTILLVDDDPDAVRLLERMLMAVPHRYRILAAYDGGEALHTMEAVEPDVVFLDLVMPGVDGRQVFGAMRADERLCQIPVVIISGQDWMDSRVNLGTSLHVVVPEPLPLARGIACLKALLDSVAPDYLINPEAL